MKAMLERAKIPYDERVGVTFEDNAPDLEKQLFYLGPPGMNVGEFRDPPCADAHGEGRVRSVRA
jgi:hypothetical protein